MNKIREAYENAANYQMGMEPEFYSDRVMFMVTLKNLNYKHKALKDEALKGSLNTDEDKLLLFIIENPKITQNEIKRKKSGLYLPLFLF